MDRLNLETGFVCPRSKGAVLPFLPNIYAGERIQEGKQQEGNNATNQKEGGFLCSAQVALATPGRGTR